MASIFLPATAANLPDQSASNLSASLQTLKGTGSSPLPFYVCVVYPDASTTGAMWELEYPPEAAGTLTSLKLFWMGNTTSAQAVRWSVQVAALSNSATTSVLAHNYSTANLATANNGTTTARQMNTTAITLTNADSAAPGQIISILVQRIGADAADTMTQNAELLGCELTYS